MSNDHDPCLMCRMLAKDVTTCPINNGNCHRQELIDDVHNTIRQRALNYPEIEGGAEAFVDTLFQGAFIMHSSHEDVPGEYGDRRPLCTHPHAERQSDEVFCPDCGFRCDHRDPDAPECI